MHIYFHSRRPIYALTVYIYNPTRPSQLPPPQRLGMEVREEMMEILEKVWTKLQGLPEANSLELGAFFILILFVGELMRRVVMRRNVENLNPMFLTTLL